jgi:hypothetical protein
MLTISDVMLVVSAPIALELQNGTPTTGTVDVRGRQRWVTFQADGHTSTSNPSSRRTAARRGWMTGSGCASSRPARREVAVRAEDVSEGGPVAAVFWYAL